MYTFELFEEIIFPVLLNGYNNKNIASMVWLDRNNKYKDYIIEYENIFKESINKH